LYERPRRHDRHPELSQLFMSARRQVEPPGDILAFEGSDDDVEQQLQVERAARERSLHAHDECRVG
jgi:hypothetical protein